VPLRASSVYGHPRRWSHDTGSPACVPTRQVPASDVMDGSSFGELAVRAARGSARSAPAVPGAPDLAMDRRKLKRRSFYQPVLGPYCARLGVPHLFCTDILAAVPAPGHPASRSTLDPHHAGSYRGEGVGAASSTTAALGHSRCTMTLSSRQIRSCQRCAGNTVPLAPAVRRELGGTCADEPRCPDDLVRK
jgi:hypothetical protein